MKFEIKEINKLYFFSKPIDELIESYDEIELEIQNIIFQNLSTMLASIATLKGEVIFINDIGFSLNQRYDDSNRVLVVSILETDRLVKQKPNVNQTFLEINEIGYIRAVEFITSDKITETIFPLYDSVVNFIKTSYLAIESSLINKISQLEKNLTANIYELIDIQIKLDLKEKLICSYLLSVTKLSRNQDKENKFLFYFTAKYLDDVISKLKANQHQYLSPIEMIFSLAFSEAPDDGIELYKGDVRHIDLEASELNKKTSQYYDFWIAEKTLFTSDIFSGDFLVLNSDYLLAINYPGEFATLFKSILPKILPEIEEQFKENTTRFHKMYSVKKSIKSKKRSKVWEEVKDISTSIIAKLGAEMTK